MLQQIQEEILRFGNSFVAQLWNKSPTFLALDQRAVQERKGALLLNNSILSSNWKTILLGCSVKT